MIQVLYEDNHLIAVYKPAGLLVQADKSNDETLMDQVKEYIKITYHKPGNVFLGLLHRLDRRVEGIILFAKTSKGAARLSEQFRTRQVKKIYHAAVVRSSESKLLPTQTLTHFLKKDPHTNTVSVFDHEVEGAKKAILEYRVVEKHLHSAVIEITLQTGRSHQIRAQLAAIGCPIIGDKKYGDTMEFVAYLPKSPYDGKQGIALCATSLSFHLATGTEEKTIMLPVPSAWHTLP